jgi:hypothetical protein
MNYYQHEEIYRKRTPKNFAKLKPDPEKTQRFQMETKTYLPFGDSKT